MSRLTILFTVLLLACSGVFAATTSTKISVTANVNLTGVSASATGTATFSPGIPDTSGTFSSTISVGTTLSGPTTITLPGGILSGTLTLPVSILTPGTTSSSGTLAITGGTGTYSGSTGSFALTGTGSIGVSGISISFTGTGSITTGSGGTTTATPTITAVQDAASNTAKIPQGGIFIVKGSNLSASGYTPFSPPRPTLSSGVKVTFTPAAGGTGIDSYLVYLYNQGGVNQIAAILPSTVAAGNYNVTVTNGTAVSAGFSTQVVTSKIGLFTQDSSGTGLASLQNYISTSVVDLNRLTTGSVSGVTISPAKPGQPVIAYGTGLGAYAAGDNDGSKAYYDFNANGT